MDRPDCFTVDTSGFDPYNAGTYEIKVSCTNDFAEKYSIDDGTVSFKATVKGNEPQPSVKVGDTSGDGEITPLDASYALSTYAAIATGGADWINDGNFYIYDVDNSGDITPLDASLILSFYAYTATGGTIDDMAVWIEQQYI